MRQHLDYPSGLDCVIMHVLAESEYRITQQGIETRIAGEFGIARRIVRKRIRLLVEKGELEYSSHYGCSFIELSFSRAVRISKHVIIKPPEVKYIAIPGDVVVSLLAGVSFGTGKHPTTCLCVRAIDNIMTGQQFPEDGLGVDIGTGSGILAIVAVALGLKHSQGTDLDTNARYEAMENAKINGFGGRICVSDKNIDMFDCKFLLITANLRFPTIQSLCLSIYRITLPGAFVVISGIRNDEAAQVISFYTENGFVCIANDSERGWSCVVLRKLVNMSFRLQ
ncbi:MAG: 50S ribosomal protein L11 methyltransferase [Proteobacteria bacterium]|nr:50S ribosomal protein L11 methyltransferase [Pseudomonadota bacterium]